MVTGANRGLGYACSRLLADHGVFVFLAARKPGVAEKAVQSLDNGSRQMLPLTLDVDEPTQQQAAMRTIAEKSGGQLDFLVNNAAIYPDEPGDTFEEAAAKLGRALHTNTLAPVQLIAAALPLLKRSTNPRVVNVSSRIGSFAHTANPDSPSADAMSLAYQTSKAALNMATSVLAKQMATHGIHLSAISPGWCRTEMGSDRAPRSAEDGAGDIVDHLLNPPEDSHGAFFSAEGRLPW